MAVKITELKGGGESHPCSCMGIKTLCFSLLWVDIKFYFITSNTTKPKDLRMKMLCKVRLHYFIHLNFIDLAVRNVNIFISGRGS